jgi:hypothetical protein
MDGIAVSNQVQHISEGVWDLWVKSQLAAPINTSPVDWFVNQLVEQVDQIIANSYGGPLPQCEEALELARLKIKEWVYRG